MENGKAAMASNLVNGIGARSMEFYVLRPNQNIFPVYVFQRAAARAKNAPSSPTLPRHALWPRHQSEGVAASGVGELIEKIVGEKNVEAGQRIKRLPLIEGQRSDFW
jgi:hypothetical protein